MHYLKSTKNDKRELVEKEVKSPDHIGSLAVSPYERK